MSLWKNRNFTILFSGQLVSTLGDNLFNIALLWYVFSITHSKGDLAITGFATTLPPLLGIFVGVLVDRWKKKTTMMVSDVLRGLILLLLYTLSAFAVPSFWIIVLLVVSLEMIGTFFSPAASALLPQIVASEDYATAAGMNMSGSAFASLAGTLAGGAVMALIGAPLLFLGDAVSFFMSVVSLVFVRVQEAPRVKVEHTSLVLEWKEGMRAIMKSPYLLQSGFNAALNNFSLGATGIVMTVWVKDSLHGTAFTLSTINTGLLIGMILGGLSATHLVKRFRYRMITCWTLVGLGLGVSLTAVWANAWWDTGAIFVSGWMLGAVDGVGGGLRMRMVPEEVRGRVFSTMGTMGRMAIPLGVAALGTMMVYVPLFWVLILTGVGPVLGGLSYLLPFSRKIYAEIDAPKTTKSHATEASLQNSQTV